MTNEPSPYGFTFGPITVERTWGDPRIGYGVQVRVGKEVISIESSPQGRSVRVTKHVGANKWQELK